MDKSDAKLALTQDNTAIGPIGVWTYVLGPYDYSCEGKVLHFWPFENRKPRDTPLAKATYLYDEIAICGMTNYNLYTPWDDFYNRSVMPRCKRCTRKLQKLADG